MRFHALERQSLWDDEVSTLSALSVPLRDETAYFRTWDTQPPLYFLQLRLWRYGVGDSLSSLRANSAFWGSLSVAALYGLASSLPMPSLASLLAMMILAFSPFHLAYSQELRPYAFAIFLAILGFWMIERLLKEPGRKFLWGLFFVLLVAELYTHYWESFVVMAQVVYGVFRFSERRRWIWLGLAAAALLTFSLWTPILWNQLHVVKQANGFWLYAPSGANLWRTYLAYTGVYFRFASSDFSLTAPWMARVLVISAYAIGLFWGCKSAPRAARLWLCFGLGTPFALSYWKPELYLWYRYTSIIYPAFVLWVVSGFSSIPSKVWRRLCVLLVLGAGLWGCWQYFSTWEKANPKAVMAYVNGRLTPQTVVVRPGYFSDLFSYYYKGSAPVLNQNEQDSTGIRARLKEKDVLLLAFDVPSDPVSQAFLTEFKVIESRHFPGFAHLGVTVYSLRGSS